MQERKKEFDAFGIASLESRDTGISELAPCRLSCVSNYAQMKTKAKHKGA
jgi:hypothetical protein